MIGKSEDGKEVIVDFNKILKIKDCTNMKLNLSKKRIYISAADAIVKDIEFASKFKNFFTSFYEIKSAIDDRSIKTREDLMEIVNDYILNDKSIKKGIVAYVKENHTISIEAKGKNEELQFTDSMARMIIGISMFCRIVIPLLTHYMFVNDVKKDEELFIITFSKIYSIFDKDDLGTNIDIAAKLNKFVSTAVENTLYSDQVIWNYLKNVSIFSRILSIELFRRVIKDIIPKLEINKSVISFLHVVLKRQIEFQFTQNIKIKFKPIVIIRTENESSSSINPFTKIEQKLVRSNEGEYLLNKEAINNFICDNRQINSHEEMDYYTSVVKVNSLQVKILNFFINKSIGNGINIYLCNKEEYLHILLICRKWLEKNNFKFLASILLSEPVIRQSKRNFNKGNLLASIVESKSYENITSKYDIIDQKLIENKIIVNFIGEILNTDFEYVKLYNEEEQPADFVEYPLKNGIGEILSFIERI